MRGVRAHLETRASRPAGAGGPISLDGPGLIRGEAHLCGPFFLSCNRSDCVQFEHWYCDPFGCRRLLSDWAGAWIAFKNGLLLDAADGWSGMGLYCYTMCKIWYDAICEGGFAGRHC